ncbi:MAG: DnaJ domain-containing protein [Acidobacteriota bacterium]
MANDFYSVLALPRNATEEQVRARFRELARERHPDRFQGAEKDRAELDFQAITQAFNVLSDSAQRRDHDHQLARPVEPAKVVDARNLGRVYLQRGIKAYRERNFAAAVENFDAAVQEDRGNAQAWHHLSLACSQDAGQMPRALIAIERACQLTPMNPGYLKLAGRLAAETGDIQKAERFYREAINWGGDDPQVAAALDALAPVRRRGFFGRSG